MNSQYEQAAEAAEGEGLLVLGVLSLVMGAAVGLVGAVFRLFLQWCDHLREAFIAWAHAGSVAGFSLVTAVCAAATALAAWLVHHYSPDASGSGIPRVEAVLHKELPPAPLVLLPVKFAGGVLAIGSGLALGREGPSVQMGAVTAHLGAKLFRRDWRDCRVLLAAGAGAGLATAFNAPIAGAVFVLEELVRRFETRIAVAALGVSATAMVVARLLLGNATDFQVRALPYVSPEAALFLLALGLVAGVVAVVYNLALLGAIRAAGPPRSVARGTVRRTGRGRRGDPGLVRAAGGRRRRRDYAAHARRDGNAGGDSAGVPAAPGTEHHLLRRPNAGGTLRSHARPGGPGRRTLRRSVPLCIPSLGRAAASLRGRGDGRLFHRLAVRAPITGIVLVTEMTASFTMLLPMLGACFAAMLVPTWLGNAPIYDSLREESLKDFQLRGHLGPSHQTDKTKQH